MKRKGLIVACILLFVASVFAVVFSGRYRKTENNKTYEDGVVEVDPYTIELKESGVRVNFSEVILSQPTETRKLVVMEQEATVSSTIDNEQLIGLDIFDKTQTVTYTATGSFVVDLDALKEENVITDHDNKTLTIRVAHPRLDRMEIDPRRIIVGDQQKGLLAFGNLKLTVNDYVSLEQNLQRRLNVKLNTQDNIKKADDIALRMVRETFEPVVHAIDPDYSVIVEFQ